MRASMRLLPLVVLVGLLLCLCGSVYGQDVSQIMVNDPHSNTEGERKGEGLVEREEPAYPTEGETDDIVGVEGVAEEHAVYETEGTEGETSDEGESVSEAEADIDTKAELEEAEEDVPPPPPSPILPVTEAWDSMRHTECRHLAESLLDQYRQDRQTDTEANTGVEADSDDPSSDADAPMDVETEVDVSTVTTDTDTVSDVSDTPLPLPLSAISTDVSDAPLPLPLSVSDRAELHMLLGLMYTLGLGDVQDVSLGLTHLTSAHRLGHDLASLSLAASHLYGWYGATTVPSVATMYLNDINDWIFKERQITAPYFEHDKPLLLEEIPMHKAESLDDTSRSHYLTEMAMKGDKASARFLGYSSLVGYKGATVDHEAAAQWMTVALGASPHPMPEMDQVQEVSLAQAHRWIESRSSLAGWTMPEGYEEAKDPLTREAVDLYAHATSHLGQFMPWHMHGYDEVLAQVLASVDGVPPETLTVHEDPHPLVPGHMRYYTYEQIGDAYTQSVPGGTHEALFSGVAALGGMEGEVECTEEGVVFGMLGHMYLEGLGMDKDLAHARVMYLASASAGCHMGLTGMGYLSLIGYRPGGTVQPRASQAIAPLSVATLSGSSESMFYLSALTSHRMDLFLPLADLRSLYSPSNPLVHHVYDIPMLRVIATATAKQAAQGGHLGGLAVHAYLSLTSDDPAVQMDGVDMLLDTALRVVAHKGIISNVLANIFICIFMNGHHQLALTGQEARTALGMHLDALSLTTHSPYRLALSVEKDPLLSAVVQGNDVTWLEALEGSASAEDDDTDSHAIPTVTLSDAKQHMKASGSLPGVIEREREMVGVLLSAGAYNGDPFSALYLGLLLTYTPWRVLMDSEMYPIERYSDVTGYEVSDAMWGIVESGMPHWMIKLSLVLNRPPELSALITHLSFYHMSYHTQEYMLVTGVIRTGLYLTSLSTPCLLVLVSLMALCTVRLGWICVGCSIRLCKLMCTGRARRALHRAQAARQPTPAPLTDEDAEDAEIAMIERQFAELERAQGGQGAVEGEREREEEDAVADDWFTAPAPTPTASSTATPAVVEGERERREGGEASTTTSSMSITGTPRYLGEPSPERQSDTDTDSDTEGEGSGPARPYPPSVSVVGAEVESEREGEVEVSDSGAWESIDIVHSSIEGVEGVEGEGVPVSEYSTPILVSETSLPPLPSNMHQVSSCIPSDSEGHGIEGVEDVQCVEEGEAEVEGIPFYSRPESAVPRRRSSALPSARGISDRLTGSLALGSRQDSEAETMHCQVYTDSEAEADGYVGRREREREAEVSQPHRPLTAMEREGEREGEGAGGVSVSSLSTPVMHTPLTEEMDSSEEETE
ncbi:hypothetical protein KIPB_001308 [Kipferlia bialata]|uniref:Uncharacterized protein n=1 Tax=Kipferlia bialata TaxID=797122 RepID=A0A9K3CQI1_9EUKA|nr:hypothetical protein KIPB_001308 [Kipferlia bialata]|eukprot:g1308.t1